MKIVFSTIVMIFLIHGNVLASPCESGKIQVVDSMVLYPKEIKDTVTIRKFPFALQQCQGGNWATTDGDSILAYIKFLKSSSANQDQRDLFVEVFRSEPQQTITDIERMLNEATKSQTRIPVIFDNKEKINLVAKSMSDCFLQNRLQLTLKGDRGLSVKETTKAGKVSSKPTGAPSDKSSAKPTGKPSIEFLEVSSPTPTPSTH